MNDGKSRGSWQNAKSQRKDPARDKWPLAKVKGIYCNKVYCFAGLVKSSTDKLLWNYSTSTQQKQRKAFNNKTLFATVPPTKHYSRYSTHGKIFNKGGYFRQKQMQLSKADNQLSRQQASTFYKSKIVIMPSLL